jgi:o-succinylbenzoate---CoA ligase
VGRGVLSAPWLSLRAACTPERTALWQDGRSLSFGELETRVHGLGVALRELGVCAGDVVAVLHANDVRFAELFHAVDRCGAVWLPLNLRLTPRELCFQLGDSGARWLVHDAAHTALACATAKMAPGVVLGSADALSGRASAPAAPDPASGPDPAAPFAILYTSGTTGRPKGACLSRAAFLWSALSTTIHLGLREDDRWLACLPLFHVGGLSILVRSAVCGVPVVLQPRFDALAVSEALDAQRISHVSLTTTMLQRALDARGDRPAPPGLRCVLLGGGPCPRALFERARAAQFPIALTYGLTETASQVATCPPWEDASAGLRPLLGTELRILDATGSPLPETSEGEIWVRSPSVMTGYVREPAGSASPLRDGWLRTGDMGALAAGRLQVLDRRSDLIISGGANIYPAEIEAALLEHPSVSEAGVVGIDDPDYGRRPAAWWVLRPGAAPISSQALRAFCRERLASYKVPVAFHQVASLPRNVAGKLLRQRLSEAFGPRDASAD